MFVDIYMISECWSIQIHVFRCFYEITFIQAYSHIIKCKYFKKGKQTMESKHLNLQIFGHTELVYSLNYRNKCFLRTSDCLLIFISEAWVSLSEGLPRDSRGSMRVSRFKPGCTLCHVNSWDMITSRMSGEDSSPFSSGFLTGSHYRVGVHHDVVFTFNFFSPRCTAVIQLRKKICCKSGVVTK